MKKKICFLLVFAVLLFSCKSKQSVKELSANETLATSKIVNGHYANKKDFSTLNIRTSANFKDNKNSYSFSADIRIKKNEIIWINVKLLGFPIAKAFITPDKVSYYEKINGTYFDGDFSLLSNWLGTDLDFNKLQNLLIGNAIDDLTASKYLSKVENEMYQLTEKDQANTLKLFYFEAANFLLKKETILQTKEGRSLEIYYPSYEKQNNIFLPSEINIKAQQEDTVLIDLVYKNILFNENLSYPFSIPGDYEEIKVN
jgi:hypothetical protein